MTTGRATVQMRLPEMGGRVVGCGLPFILFLVAALNGWRSVGSHQPLLGVGIAVNTFGLAFFLTFADVAIANAAGIRWVHALVVGSASWPAIREARPLLDGTVGLATQVGVRLLLFDVEYFASRSTTRHDKVATLEAWQSSASGPAALSRGIAWRRVAIIVTSYGAIVALAYLHRAIT